MIGGGILYGLATPPPDRGEILRYAGMRQEADPRLAALLEECLAELEPSLSGRICFREFPICRRADGLDLGFTRCDSQDAERNLAGCDRLVLFAATVGLAPDRLMTRYASSSPTKALLVQAIGAERIEALCDAFCRELSRQKALEGRRTRPRFSPGYGDLPTTLQTDFFRVLDCEKIGLCLNESLLMSPTKSVTAWVGLSVDETPDGTAAGCAGCAKRNCEMRK